MYKRLYRILFNYCGFLLINNYFNNISVICTVHTIINQQNIPVIYKCCPLGKLLTDGQCITSEHPLLHPFELPPAYNWPSLKIARHANFNMTNGNPICPSFMYYLDPIEVKSEEYHLLVNGSLYRGDGTILDPNDYCFDVAETENAVRPAVCFPAGEELYPNDFEEESDTEDMEDQKIYRLYPFGMLISVPFLFFTFLVYACIKQLRNLHGCCLMSHVASLLIGYTCLATVQIATSVMGNISCKAIGFSVQYFFLATFFWLNVMCIDIYWAFSSLRLVGAVGGETRKLILYSLYAWGSPLIILLITVAVDFTDFVPLSSPFKPKVGINKCFFDDRTSAYMYFYGPMAILLCVNLILFGITACKIWRTKKETSYQLNRTDSRRHSEKQENERFKLYMKLFLVMGINWIAELVSFIIGEEVPRYLWYVTDLTNTLQGVFIFIIFVWKRRVRRLVLDRLCMFGGHKRISRSRGGTASDATTTTTTTSFNNNSAASVARINSNKNLSVLSSANGFVK